MRILIVGAGIAGPTLAYWLLRAGHQPTLVECASQLRRGGYLVDFWGAGFEVAERMGIVPELRRRGYVLTEARAVPNFENGVPAGYKLFQIVPGSIFDALGLKNGDTISAINGQSINDPAKAFEMLNELKSGAKNFEITMKRDGRTSTNNYDIR